MLWYLCAETEKSVISKESVWLAFSFIHPPIPLEMTCYEFCHLSSWALSSGLRSSPEQQEDDDNTDGITECFLAAKWLSVFQKRPKLACAHQPNAEHLSESDVVIVESMSYESALIG